MACALPLAKIAKSWADISQIWLFIIWDTWAILSLMNRQLDELYRIDNYNDTFALGHYARVMDALDRRSGHIVAFKVMRPEHLSADGEVRWEYRAFANEANLLMKLADSPHVVDLLDCGYVSSPAEHPESGEIRSFQRDVMGFVDAIDDYAAQSWRPYLALQNLPRTRNLLYLMKPNHPGVRWRLPSEEGIALALQFANVLKLAHQQNIVYMDHKLEHVYWDGTNLQIIDLNSSRQLNPAENGHENQFCMDIHNLCVGILYPVFTGLSPQKAALRPQPGRISDVEERYKNITELDFGVEPTLSEGIKNLLQAGAAMELPNVEAFIEGLRVAGAELGWDFPNHYTSPSSRDARTQMRAGISKLRNGQENLREARELFREAAIQDGITADLESELRRLVKSVNDMLTHRVIP
jgi:serine/threonine protein kinase